MNKVYERTENGTVTTVERAVGLAEINAAMMGDTKKTVRTMSSINRTDYAIDYKDGRSVRLVLVDAPASEGFTNFVSAVEAEEQPDDGAPWTVASHRTLLHKFTEASENGRAVCNKSYRPWRYADGYAFRTRSEHAVSQYANLYTYCPRCEAK